MKKILIVGGENICQGGIQNFNANWIKNAPEEYKFTLYTLGSIIDKEFYKKMRKCADIIALDINKKKKISRYMEFTFNFSRLLKKVHFDVLHVNVGNVVVALLATKIAFDRKIPMRITYAHGAWDENKKLRKILFYFGRKYLQSKTTRCVACSIEAGRKLYGEKIEYSKKWKKHLNTIETEKYIYNNDVRIEYRKKLSIKEDHIILGCVGRLDRNKNQEHAIRVLKKVKDYIYPEVILLLIGVGERKFFLEEKAKELGINASVIFLGYSNCVENWLQAMDVFLMPSISEGLPLSALEAQAAGLPCVLSDTISKETNISGLVEFASIKNIEEWVEKICLVIAKKSDRVAASESACHSGIDNSNLSAYIKELYGDL